MLGQTYLDGLGLNLDHIEKILGRPIVNLDDLTDFGAMLNATSKRLSEDPRGLNCVLKARIKTELLQAEKDTWQGKTFEVFLTRLEVNRLDTERVKQFLGKRLSDYSHTDTQIRLGYRPRS